MNLTTVSNSPFIDPLIYSQMENAVTDEETLTYLTGNYAQLANPIYYPKILAEQLII